MRQLDRSARPIPGVDLSAETKLAYDETDPDQSRYVAFMIMGAWLALGVAFACALPLVAVPVRALFGNQAGDAVALVVVTGAFFCLGGCVNAVWRMLWYVPQARRRLETFGVDGEPFRRSMRRTIPGNVSLVFQLAFAVVIVFAMS